MKIRLLVLEGPNKGKQFEFDQPDRFLVGRSSQCHFQITEDDSISRQHFILEINPPHCFIRDNNSGNGTFVKHKREIEFSKVTSTELLEDSLIRVGKTILRVTIDVVEEPEGPFFCIRCAKDNTENLRGKHLDKLTPLDFVCPLCRQNEVQLQHQQDHSISKCISCKTDVSDYSNLDGRRAELEGIALYLCERCAISEKSAIADVKEYRILSELGKGGMGVVYKGLHKVTGRVVAIKTLLSQGTMSIATSKRFQREMAVMAQLMHPNIVRLTDQGLNDGCHYFVSEYLPLGDADQLLSRRYGGPLPPKHACGIVLQVLKGLDYAHRLGYVHRDIKLQNILLRQDEEGEILAKLGDFGLAKNFEQAGNSSLTTTGTVAGTLLCMAPEQFTNFRYVTPRADIYSMAVSLYYLLSAKYPYALSRHRDPIVTVLHDEPFSILEMNPDVPFGLAAIVDKAIKKQADLRFQSAAELSEAISTALQSVP